MRTTHALAATLTVPLALLLACGGESEDPAPAEDAAPAERRAPSEDASSEVPAARADLGAITIAPPDAWTPRAPSSPVRQAEYAIEGESGEATCVVFHFPSGAGSVEDNIARWCGQFAQPDGSDSRESAEISTTTVDDMPVTTVWLTGTYVAETFPGSSVRVNNPGWAMSAAIVETSDGNYYFKLTGPESIVAPQRDAFDRMIASAEAG